MHHDLNFLDAGIPVVIISRVLANAILEERKAPPVKSEFTGADAVERAKARTAPPPSNT